MATEAKRARMTAIGRRSSGPVAGIVFSVLVVGLVSVFESVAGVFSVVLVVFLVSFVLLVVFLLVFSFFTGLVFSAVGL